MFDIACIQETHSSFSDEKYWENEWGGKIFFSHGDTNSRGVCILLKPNLNYKIIKLDTHPSGRYIFIDVLISDQIYTLVCLYGPNNDVPTFFSNISSNLLTFKGDNIILSGDFNFVFNLELDKKGGNSNTNFKARTECLALMNTHHLIDIWRERNPRLKHFTWSSNITPGIHCRLDFFLVAKHLCHAISNVSFSPGIQSDHSFVQLTISHQSFKSGPGLWKLNNSLLNDPDFIVLITDLIENELSHSNVVAFDPGIRWDFIKFKIRQASIKFSKQKARERNRKEKTILNRVASLEQSLYVCETAETRAQLREAQNELLVYYNYKLQGTIIRSRARWVEEGEKNSKYFLNLEKRNRTSNAIFKIRNATGELLVENKLILNEIKEFYKSLYASSDCDPQMFIHDLPSCELDDDESLYCEGTLTLDECSQAIKSMQNDKSPGSDGLSVHFYRNFGTLLVPLF